MAVAGACYAAARLAIKQLARIRAVEEERQRHVEMMALVIVLIASVMQDNKEVVSDEVVRGLTVSFQRILDTYVLRPETVASIEEVLSLLAKLEASSG